MVDEMGLSEKTGAKGSKRGGWPVKGGPAGGHPEEGSSREGGFWMYGFEKKNARRKRIEGREVFWASPGHSHIV